MMRFPFGRTARMHCLEATIIHDSLLESRGGGVAGMTTLGRCSWAAREKESHGLLPLYVALVTGTKPLQS